MIPIVLSCFLFALMPLMTGRWLSGRWAWTSAAFPLVLFGYFLTQAPVVAGGGELYHEVAWASALDIYLSFRLDGLSLLFALMITGIGSLVYLYAGKYLEGHPQLGRFYGFLSMFMGAMLGLVLSDNVLVLFIFWELTSISSFFLIGFKSEDDGSRRSAITALSITGFGGLALLGAALLLGDLSGTYSIRAMSEVPGLIQGSEYYVILLVLIFLAAFTKSAQFPFHFWLPGAMKAPTPVSTYLHSATMVKAGVFLLMRFSPALAGDPLWHNTLLAVGGVTMVYTAVHTVFRTDLKSILAYSTLAALGMLIFLIGLGTGGALFAAAVFLLVHAMYKAALFLIAGIVDHATGTRDVTRLGGLGRTMWVVGAAAVLAALSNAGIPPMFGFVGKDLVYEATLHTGAWNWLLTGTALVTNVLLLYAGFQVGIRPFFARVKEVLPVDHLPGWKLWLPPLLLGVGSLAFGLFPRLLGGLVFPAAQSMGATDVPAYLALWHGFNTVLLLSGLTIATGVALYMVLRPSLPKEQFIERMMSLSTERMILGGAEAFRTAGNRVTRFFQNGYLRHYVFTILAFLVMLMAWLLFNGLDLHLNLRQVLELTVYEVAILGIMFVAILFTIHTRSRLTAIAALGVVGYGMCLVFVFYSAPDLAITQFTIDTLTVILFVLVVYRLPRYLRFSHIGFRIRDAVLASFFGCMIILLILEVLNENMKNEVGQYYADNAYVLAKGKNVVNVILVDYRGLDTLVEIAVLVIAAIGVFGLLKLHLSKAEKRNT